MLSAAKHLSRGGFAGLRFFAPLRMTGEGMGEDVEARRKFIEQNARDVKNLDI